jgi:hypothetical protein
LLKINKKIAFATPIAVNSHNIKKGSCISIAIAVQAHPRQHSDEQMSQRQIDKAVTHTHRSFTLRRDRCGVFLTLGSVHAIKTANIYLSSPTTKRRMHRAEQKKPNLLQSGFSKKTITPKAYCPQPPPTALNKATPELSYAR